MVGWCDLDVWCGDVGERHVSETRSPGDGHVELSRGVGWQLFSDLPPPFSPFFVRPCVVQVPDNVKEKDTKTLEDTVAEMEVVEAAITDFREQFA